MASITRRAVSRATLLDEVWGYRTDVGSNVVDAVVRRIRDKLGHRGSALETIRGSGYRLHYPLNWRLGRYQDRGVEIAPVVAVPAGLAAEEHRINEPQVQPRRPGGSCGRRPLRR